jgi:hypothetical protein
MSSAQRLIPTFDPLRQMIAWEEGQLDHDETVQLFQHIVNTGIVWCLHGIYGRTAHDLIQAGLVRV